MSMAFNSLDLLKSDEDEDEDEDEQKIFLRAERHAYKMYREHSK